MEPSQACVDLIKQFEGCKLKAYLDPAGVPTIGYGHTSTSVALGDTITQAQAEAYLLQDLRRTWALIMPLIKVPLTQGQCDACADFAYNLGPERFKRSTLLMKLSAGDYTGAANEFIRWNQAAGKVLAGLVKRRDAERALFLGEAKA